MVNVISVLTMILIFIVMFLSMQIVQNMVQDIQLGLVPKILMVLDIFVVMLIVLMEETATIAMEEEHMEIMVVITTTPLLKIIKQIKTTTNGIAMIARTNKAISIKVVSTKTMFPCLPIKIVECNLDQFHLQEVLLMKYMRSI